jgi:SEC-C motif domain protein
MSISRCPCRKKSEIRTFAGCCGPHHAGQTVAPTAEALMRSRYSAFALGNAQYLLETWHRSTRPAVLSLDPGQAWLLLRVLAAHTDGDAATVEFIARSRNGSGIQVLHEVSRFARDGGRWLYVDGGAGT